MGAPAATLSRRTPWGPWVQAALVLWGEWQIRHGELNGYPPRSAVSRIFEVSGGVARDRVLCADMPGRVWRVHRAWLNLGDIYRQALYCKYALPPREDGTLMTDREVAVALGVSRDVYRWRVKQGRHKLAHALQAQPDSGEAPDRMASVHS